MEKRDELNIDVNPNIEDNDNEYAIHGDLIKKINDEPENAITHLIENNHKFEESHIHLLFVLIENGWYKASENAFIDLPINRATPGRIHKHIDDISEKIREYVETLNNGLDKESNVYQENILMGKQWKKNIFFKFFPEQAQSIYNTESEISQVLTSTDS